MAFTVTSGNMIGGDTVVPSRLLLSSGSLIVRNTSCARILADIFCCCSEQLLRSHCGKFSSSSSAVLPKSIFSEDKSRASAPIMSSLRKASPTCSAKILAVNGIETARINYEVSFERFATLSGTIYTNNFFLPEYKHLVFNLILKPHEGSDKTLFLLRSPEMNAPFDCSVSSWLMKKNGDFYMNQGNYHELTNCNICKSMQYLFLRRRFETQRKYNKQSV